MIILLKNCRRRLKAKCFQYLTCGVKTATFLFWMFVYMMAMKMTIFKGSGGKVVETNYPLDLEPDNYSKRLMRGPFLEVEEVKPELFMQAWSEPDNETISEMAERVARVQRVCKKRSLNKQKVNTKDFFVDHAHNLVWCIIFKAASSSWLYNFNILGGYNRTFLERTGHVPLLLARKLFPRPSLEELADAVNTPGVVTLLVVREPFVRLLSAYRDKLENVPPLFYRKLAKSIMKEHRKEATKIFGPIKSLAPTFYEFIAHVIKSAKNNGSFNEHWSPYYRFCSPCAVNFTVIGKVETISRDSSYVIQQLGLHLLNRRMENTKIRLHTVINKSRDGRNTTDLLKQYFGQLDKRMLEDLLQIYGVDFEMFGYDPKVYSRYVRD